MGFLCQITKDYALYENGGDCVLCEEQPKWGGKPEYSHVIDKYCGNKHVISSDFLDYCISDRKVGDIIRFLPLFFDDTVRLVYTDGAAFIMESRSMPVKYYIRLGVEGSYVDYDFACKVANLSHEISLDRFQWVFRWLSAFVQREKYEGKYDLCFSEDEFKDFLKGLFEYSFSKEYCSKTEELADKYIPFLAKYGLDVKLKVVESFPWELGLRILRCIESEGVLSDEDILDVREEMYCYLELEESSSGTVLLLRAKDIHRLVDRYFLRDYVAMKVNIVEKDLVGWDFCKQFDTLGFLMAGLLRRRNSKLQISVRGSLLRSFEVTAQNSVALMMRTDIMRKLGEMWNVGLIEGIACIDEHVSWVLGVLSTLIYYSTDDGVLVYDTSKSVFKIPRVLSVFDLKFRLSDEFIRDNIDIIWAYVLYENSIHGYISIDCIKREDLKYHVKDEYVELIWDRK